jgi:hypothetical protein
MKRLLWVLFIAGALQGCANSQQKPPSCKGEYARINSPDKYASGGPQGAASTSERSP